MRVSISVNLKDHFRLISVRANSGCPSVSSECGEHEPGRSISRPAKLRTDETHERRAPRCRAITALRGIHISPCFCYCGAPSRKIHVPFAFWHPWKQDGHQQHYRTHLWKLSLGSCSGWWAHTGTDWTGKSMSVGAASVSVSTQRTETLSVWTKWSSLGRKPDAGGVDPYIKYVISCDWKRKK